MRWRGSTKRRSDWEDVVRTKKRRLEVATGDERFELLLEIGDVEFAKLDDRTRAAKTYVAALDERPDDRKLLTKLMQLYSEEKDWAKLVEVVLRLADFVEDPKQRAKYMHTAAIVSRAAARRDRPGARLLRAGARVRPDAREGARRGDRAARQKGDHEGVERLLKVQLEQAKADNDRAKIVEVARQLGRALSEAS